MDIEMGRWLYGFVCLVFSAAVQVQAQDSSRVVCFLRNNNDLDSDFLTRGSRLPCTHVIYSYARIDADTNSVNLDFLANIDPVLRNSPVTTMIQIGGEEDRDVFSEVTSTPSRRRQFIQSIISLTDTYKYIRGVSLHWMFPGRSDPPEKRNYVSLAQELRKEYNGTVSMLLPNQRELIIPGFNLLFLNYVVDFFILPAYNFTVDAPPNTYHHSPLDHPPESKIADNSLMSMTKLYLRIGAVAERLVLGIPLFGRLVNTDTMEIVAYELPNNQICQMVGEGGWTEKGGLVTGPLLEKGNQIISYDTPASVIEKAKLAKLVRLGGVMFWTMNMDDWNNTCPNRDSTNDVYLPTIAAAYDELVPKPYFLGSITYGGLPNTSQFNEQSNSTRPFVPYAAYPAVSNFDKTTVSPTFPTRRPVVSDRPSVTNPVSYQGLGGSQSGQGSSTPANFNRFSSLLQSYLPNIKIIEAGQDIVIEDTQVQINENNYYSKRYQQSGR